MCYHCPQPIRMTINKKDYNMADSTTNNVQTVDDMSALMAPPEEEPLKVYSAPKPLVQVNTDDPTATLDTTASDNQLDQMIKLKPKDLLSLNDKATAFSKQLSTLNPSADDFARSVDEIGRIGQDAFNSTSDVTERFMSQSVKADKQQGGAKSVVSSELLELRKITDKIAPKPNTFKSSFLKKLGFGSVHDYFKQYESADDQLKAIMDNLSAGQDALQRDNGELAAQKQQLWKDMETLKKADALLEELDKEVVNQVKSARDSGDMKLADALEKDALFAVRQRRMDVKTQAAVTIQAYMSMSVIQQNNKQLIKGVDRAKSTTMVALRTAVIVAAALDDQKLVLDTLDAIDNTTNNLIANNAKMLEQNSSRIQQRAVKSGVRPETLQRAFESLARTMDSMDTFQLEANKTFAETIQTLGDQQKKIEPYLERAHKRDTDEANNTNAFGI